MLIALLTHAGDIVDARRLLEWIHQLDDQLKHDCLIVCDAGTPLEDARGLRDFARTIFQHVSFTTNGTAVKGWPAGPYSLFKAAVRKANVPFLILEPDAVPLRKGWLDEIEMDYQTCGKKFMGCIYNCAQPGLPPKLMSGIAVYPGDVIAHLVLHDHPVHWDVAYAGQMVEQGAHTPLIKHFFGQKDLPPTFVSARDEHTPINAFTLDDLPKGAVLFHRNKDGTLLRLLQRKLFPEKFCKKIVPVFNVHRGDVALAIKHVRWLCKMGHKSQHKAIVAFDVSCPITQVNMLVDALKKCFSEVSTIVYPRPSGTYPLTANLAWQAVAREMDKQANPWLWMEADAVALRPDWIERLQAEYDRAQRSWMGVVVPHMGHMNGLAVYPADAAARMPLAMGATGEAWDMACKPEVMQDCHDASRIMLHVWTVMNGNPHPVGGGQEPRAITAEQARRWIAKEHVLVHRIKDHSLLDLLLDGKVQI